MNSLERVDGHRAINDGEITPPLGAADQLVVLSPTILPHFSPVIKSCSISNNQCVAVSRRPVGATGFGNQRAVI
jgi:hypothetical protein